MATCNIASAAFECAMRGLYASSAWLGDVATERGEAVSSASVFDLDAVSVQGFALFNAKIYTEHPSLLDKADEFANALYVLEFGPQLSHLAQRCVRVDEYRPETCVAVANYYSFKNDHEKAVAYLKRAVVLDAGNSLPWTLIGHEFLEMKNQAAAIEVYRKAVGQFNRVFIAGVRN
ncbi:Anaphase-promoting complex subunit 23 [Rhizoclosmatium hyalinum]|nr:Anaphase-promoting complex subunit 23 [Rhizoclosmatium hyalinum]